MNELYNNKYIFIKKAGWGNTWLNVVHFNVLCEFSRAYQKTEISTSHSQTSLPYLYFRDAARCCKCSNPPPLKKQLRTLKLVQACKLY